MSPFFSPSPAGSPRPPLHVSLFCFFVFAVLCRLPRALPSLGLPFFSSALRAPVLVTSIFSLCPPARWSSCALCPALFLFISSLLPPASRAFGYAPLPWCWCRLSPPPELPLPAAEWPWSWSRSGARPSPCPCSLPPLRSLPLALVLVPLEPPLQLPLPATAWSWLWSRSRARRRRAPPPPLLAAVGAASSNATAGAARRRVGAAGAAGAASAADAGAGIGRAVFVPCSCSILAVRTTNPNSNPTCGARPSGSPARRLAGRGASSTGDYRTGI